MQKTNKDNSKKIIKKYQFLFKLVGFGINHTNYSKVKNDNVYCVRSKITGCCYVYISDSYLDIYTIHRIIREEKYTPKCTLLAAHPRIKSAWRLAYEVFSHSNQHQEYQDLLEDHKVLLLSFPASKSVTEKEAEKAVNNLHAKYLVLDKKNHLFC